MAGLGTQELVVLAALACLGTVVTAAVVAGVVFLALRYGPRRDDPPD